MKHLILIFTLFGTVSQASVSIDFSKQLDCKIDRYVSAPYFGDEKPEVGSTAYVQEDSQYRLITLQDLADDKFIYFKSESGKFTERYLWLYGPPREIPNTSGLSSIKFYSGSVVGDTIVTITDYTSSGGTVHVRYANTETGFMLSLKCKAQ